MNGDHGVFYSWGLLAPNDGKQDVVLSDEVRVGLTSSFLPGVSLLFGALFSYTISLLVRKSNGALSYSGGCLKAE